MADPTPHETLAQRVEDVWTLVNRLTNSFANLTNTLTNLNATLANLPAISAPQADGTPAPAGTLNLQPVLDALAAQTAAITAMAENVTLILADVSEAAT